MSRRTYSLSAVAVVAAASLSFSSADGTEAFAQDTGPDITVEAVDLGDEAVDLTADAFEIVPMDAQADSADAVEFVSNAVVQPLPEKEVVDAGGPIAADSLGELVGMVTPDELTEQMRCLAGAVYFESRGEKLAGQLAVAQVIINRAEDNRFPASYCGVVYQRAQFSFVKNGRMPNVRASSGAWRRAKAIAKIAHEGMWESEAEDAVYFHAKYVRPSWSRRKTRTAQIDTHIFYR
ncbi:MAG: cell wall hydrolase [Erythrobacter sp.]